MAKVILTIDDSLTVRKFAKRALESLGFDVKEAKDGQEGLDVCSQTMPDGILLDWNMPVMDGLDFLKALRQGAFKTQPKVIFCTKISEISNIQQALEFGADEYLMKPFDKEMLQDKLKEVGLL